MGTSVWIVIWMVQTRASMAGTATFPSLRSIALVSSVMIDMTRLHFHSALLQADSRGI